MLAVDRRPNVWCETSQTLLHGQTRNQIMQTATVRQLALLMICTFCASTCPADPPAGDGIHRTCIEHGEGCLLFCGICGHHDCSPTCPSRQPAADDGQCKDAKRALNDAIAARRAPAV